MQGLGRQERIAKKHSYLSAENRGFCLKLQELSAKTAYISQASVRSYRQQKRRLTAQ